VGRVVETIKYFFKPVHLRFIGGKENIGWRAFFDLAGQCARRAEVKNDFVGGLLFVIGGDGFHHIRQNLQRRKR
jgi:hypothetical protein